MTSELRPAVAVWWEAYGVWGDPYLSDAKAAAAVIEADREAVRAEQAAELAKFKALCVMLSGALKEIRRNHPAKSHTAITADEALRQYKEATQ